MKTTIKCRLIAMALFALLAAGCKFGTQFGTYRPTNDNASTTSSNTIAADSTPIDTLIAEELVRKTTADFARAVETADFTQMHSRASSDFQSSFTPAELKAQFRSSIHKKDLIMPALNNIGSTTVQFLTPPAVRSERGFSVMSAKGTFPSEPYQIRFEYEYIMRDGEWKLLTFGINIG